MVWNEEKGIKNELKKSIQFIFLSHTGLFIFLFILMTIYFQNDILSTLWSSFRNDSWKFIENTIQIENPPYPYHLISTSIHFYFVDLFSRIIFSRTFSLTFSILLVQYLGSLITVTITFKVIYEIFALKKEEILLYIWIIDTIILSLFLLLATAEILFILYQTLSFYMLMRKKYFYGSIFAGISVALRFNGFFFILGFYITIIKSISSDEIQGLIKVLKSIGSFLIIILVGLVPFIISQIVNNDFFRPITSELMAYSTWETYIQENQVLVIPFTYWPTYVTWVFNKNDIAEDLLLIAAIITFFLGLASLLLYKRFYRDIKIKNKKNLNYLLILLLFNFLGVNTIVSGRNFARFLSFTFPIYPIVLYIIIRLKMDNHKIILIAIAVFIIGIFLNFVWWTNTDFCSICQHFKE